LHVADILGTSIPPLLPQALQTGFTAYNTTSIP
jgi:hypothetical protein